MLTSTDPHYKWTQHLECRRMNAGVPTRQMFPCEDVLSLLVLSLLPGMEANWEIRDRRDKGKRIKYLGKIMGKN